MELDFVEKSRMSGFLDQTVGDAVNKSMSKLIEEFERSKNAIMSGSYLYFVKIFRFESLSFN